MTSRVPRALTLEVKRLRFEAHRKLLSNSKTRMREILPVLLYSSFWLGATQHGILQRIAAPILSDS
jgi:hypothetical protein